VSATDDGDVSTDRRPGLLSRITAAAGRRIAKFADIPAEMLRNRLVQSSPAKDDARTYFGRSLDLSRIERVIQNANGGFMQPMTDLGAESLSLDGHLSALVQKRFNRIAALPFEVVPARGEGVNDDLAGELAELVRNQLAQFDLREKIQDLAWGTWHGRACQELEWAMTGSRDPWAVVDMHWIHARRLSLGPSRELRITRTDADAGSFVARGIAVQDYPGKFCHFMPRLFDDYAEREGLNPRALYWSFFGRFGTRERLILIELFAKPWRIIECDPEVNHNPKALEDADEVVDALGATTSARLPPGVSLNVVQPASGSGSVHRETIQDAKEELSKLVLGVTATTDAKSDALGGGATEVHSDEQWLVLAGDCRRLSGALNQRLIRPIVLVNRGPEALLHAPIITIRAEPPPDAKQELERIDAATKAGMRISLEEAHQRTGYRRPKPDEAVLELVSDASSELSGGAPRARIVYPAGQVPPTGAVPAAPPVEVQAGTEEDTRQGDVSVTPTDVAKVHTVNEIRALAGSDPLQLPDGSPDPDGFLALPLYEAKLASKGEEYGKAAGAAQAEDEGIAKPAPAAPPNLVPGQTAQPAPHPATAPAPGSQEPRPAE
jgi:phage gp29-like protein